LDVALNIQPAGHFVHNVGQLEQQLETAWLPQID